MIRLCLAAVCAAALVTMINVDAGAESAGITLESMRASASGIRSTAAADVVQVPNGGAVRGAVWNLRHWGALGGSRPIAVCWESTDPQFQSERELVRVAVSETWAHYSMLQFTGWGECVTGARGIRIATTDLPTARVNGIGRYIDGMPRGMLLNIAYRNWETTRCGERTRCIRAIAVHEFGHAIAFVHEHVRAGAPPECQEERGPPYPNWDVTTYDAESIMNYCNANWVGGALSEKDMESVQTLYGARL